MTDRETRNIILNNKNLPIHNNYRGIYNSRDILELMLMGYGTMEIKDQLGIPKSTLLSSTARLRTQLGYKSNREMLRGLVKSHRGYL